MTAVGPFVSANFSGEIPSDTGFLALRLDTLVNLISLEDWTAYDYVLSCYGYLED